jgi:predicted transcriptional regulator
MKRKSSELERQILSRLWDRKAPSTINEILQGWSEGAVPRYTSVLKILQIMETKGLVGHVAAGKAYRWHALIERDAASRTRIRELLDGFFRGDRLGLVNALFQEVDLAPEEILRVRKMLRYHLPKEAKSGPPASRRRA